MPMRFNYENDRMLIGNWLPGAGGEFMLRCMSMSKHMILMAGPSEMRLQIDDPQDYDLKLRIFISQGPQPGEKERWHKHFINSNQWLAALGAYNDDTSIEGQFTETLFANAHLASKEFYDQFWRPIACEVSHAGLGFGIKTHLLREVEGLMHILPNAKIVVGERSDLWQKKNEGKIDIAYARLYDPLILPIPSNIDAVRLRIDDMLNNEADFISQLESAYRKLKFNDFRDCKDHIVKMRKTYLSWHLNG